MALSYCKEDTEIAAHNDSGGLVRGTKRNEEEFRQMNDLS